MAGQGCGPTTGAGIGKQPEDRMMKAADPVKAFGRLTGNLKMSGLWGFPALCRTNGTFNDDADMLVIFAHLGD